MKRLSYVEFIYDDESGSLILGYYVGTFIIRNIQPGFSGMAGEAAPNDFANDVAIEIHKDANSGKENENELNLFDHVFVHKNIIQIRFQFENDGTVYTFNVDNNFQKTYISSLGHLYIAISPRGLKNFFDFDNIEDSQIVDTHFRKDTNNEQ